MDSGISLLVALVLTILHALFTVVFLEMRMWIPLLVFLAWIALRGWREKGMAALAALLVAVGVYPGAADGNRVHCAGYGYLSPADMVRMWRASALQYLTLQPHAPWCSTEKCARKWSNRHDAAPALQVKIVREAFRLVERCVEERHSYYKCRQLLREDSRNACNMLNCSPFPYRSKPWHFKDDGTPIRVVIFAHDPEGGDVRFEVHVDDALRAPFVQKVAPGYARAFAATLKVYLDSLTGNLCPSARVKEHER